ncbi:hypothetical protein [Spirosoma oryzicola]|uniref:hypothetical protein n=1 Tax=Spirosoma oryzicola TaxID=2898794 RepID=UPI001E29AC43|nr:hypothetical protein [Spirosoma oryzicola]UHG93281.1 hypothetical protein LQ777_10350 [Spirosoma oryzicola]
MKLKDLFTTLATRAGIAETDAKLKAVIDAIPDFDVDDETVANPIKTNLITELEAESRPTIKKKLVAQALNGVDAQLEAKLSKIFTAEEIEALKKDEKPTIKKLTRLLAKYDELEASSKPGDQAELNKTILDLNGTIEKLKTDNEVAVNAVRSEYDQKLYFNSLANKVIARADVTDYAKAKEGKRVITDLQETIEAAGGVLDFKTGNVMQKADPTAQLFIDNKPATVDSMLTKTLTENEYIKKSEPAGSTTITTAGGNDGKPAQIGSGILKTIQQATEQSKAS